MQSKLIEIKASQIFDVSLKKETSIKNKKIDLEFPFNLQFKIKSQKDKKLRRPGIYFATYNDEVIYIGSYKSTKNNIISDRWVKHIQTFTNRGYRIGFNSKNRKESIPQKFKIFFEKQPLRFSDTGTVTTIERLFFAEINFDKFCDFNDNQILHDFTFFYLTMNSKSETLEVEKQLIKKFNPICNSTLNLNTEYRKIKKEILIDFILLSLKK